MKKGLIMLATLFFGVTGQLAVHAQTTTYSYSTSDQSVTVNLKTYHTKLSNEGGPVSVTQKAVTAYDLTNGQPNYQNPVHIPKNTSLNVAQKLPGATGYVVTVPGNTTEMVVRNLKDNCYSFHSLQSNAQQLKWLKHASFKWAKKLTSTQRRAVRYYTGNGYTPINGALRKISKTVPHKITNDIRAINTGLNKFKLAEPITVFRGVSKDGLRMSLGNQPVKVGAEYNDPAYSSTTVSRATALNFSHNVVLKINIPQGQRGAYIAPLSQSKGEQEFLMRRGTRMIVTKLQKAATTMRVTTSRRQKHHKPKVTRQVVRVKYLLVTLDLAK